MSRPPKSMLSSAWPRISVLSEFAHIIHLDGFHGQLPGVLRHWMILCSALSEEVLVLGATNRPHELDEAARRRFVKRLYIGLPEAAARIAIVRSLLVDQLHSLAEEELNEIARLTEGYSGADMRQLCAEAAMMPVRELYDRIDNVATEEIRSITLKDFEGALQVVRKTVVDTDLGAYETFDKKFGCLI